jgi:hypothetical protein
MNKSLVIFALSAIVLAGCQEQNQTPSITPTTESHETATMTKTTAPAANQGAKVTDATGVFKVFKVYTDGNSPDNHYVPSGWMGDYGDIKFNDKFMDKPHTGSTSVQIIYTNKATQGARWSGIYWQNPPNNWGTRPGGYDLTGAKNLTFWARGEKGGERIEEFKMGGITGEYADSDIAGIGPVVLTPEWQLFTIDLEGKDLSSISGGFCWATNLDANPEGATFYLDDIRYE